ncbi:hypothetical protein FLONG3_7452 [Fusarium longipes]|uniref:Cytidyltransferase-like domain-containing protein n=1 Tax=Fusarium longipes TaxID=694270 RepID=A0A395SD98_9HYPO|nr:hypothetical protein FLONG3_7452 [Fusarium longipes]
MPSSCLADYVERITPLVQLPSNASARPFNNGTAKNPPTLRRSTVNRIILYPGSFNPPHQGHLNLLKYAFNNVGEDLNIIAAIIVLTDDERLGRKMKSRDNAIIMPKEKRINLWRGDGIPVDWAWVYDGSEAEWARFRTHLTKNIKNDGIELKFMVLHGPDGITAAKGHNPTSWNCEDAITSDVSRPTDFRYTTTLRQLAGCSPWEKLQIDRARIEREIRAKLNGSQASGKESPDNLACTSINSETVIEEAFAKALANLETVWICRQQRSTRRKGIVRFLPCDQGKRSEDTPSSTKIRQIIDSSPPDELVKNLEGVALHPELLVQYLKELPKPIKRAVSPEEEEGDKKTPEIILW